jgi:hypothetical protein
MGWWNGMEARRCDPSGSARTGLAPGICVALAHSRRALEPFPSSPGIDLVSLLEGANCLVRLPFAAECLAEFVP